LSTEELDTFYAILIEKQKYGRGDSGNR
jgi:hypothetical protein